MKQYFLVGSDDTIRELPADRTVMIGRSAINYIVLNDRLVSRVHAHIEPSPKGRRLTDRDSANGTQLNGQTIQEAVLNHGDILRIGKYVFTVYCGTADQAGQWVQQRKSATRDDHTLAELNVNQVQETDMTGDLATLNMISLVQMLVEQKKHGSLTLTRQGEPVGAVYFTNGVIAYADTAGGLHGKPAFFELVELAQGQFRFRPNVRPPALEIMEHPAALILEACRHLDERQSGSRNGGPV